MVQSIDDIKALLDQCRNEAIEERHQTDTLFGNAVTSKIDDLLELMSSADREQASKLLEQGHWEYSSGTDHDYALEPFDKDGFCQHGFTVDTCPLGCDVAADAILEKQSEAEQLAAEWAAEQEHLAYMEEQEKLILNEEEVQAELLAYDEHILESHGHAPNHSKK